VSLQKWAAGFFQTAGFFFPSEYIGSDGEVNAISQHLQQGKTIQIRYASVIVS
jgi:hypothetical protein